MAEQRITPMLSYEDGAAAIAWLCDAFGFEEVFRLEDDDGRVGHAELRLEGARMFLAAPTPEYRGPRRLAETCEDVRRWREVPYVIDGVHVVVSDVDAHFRRAKEAGATLLSEPEDQSYGERIYRVEDFEGHRWMFAQPIGGTAT
jgi:PhnB protein